MHDFKKSNYRTTWEGPLFNVEVEYITPDFSKLSAEILGDWGPNYHFKLTECNPFVVNYRFDNGEEKTTHFTDSLTLRSPFHFMEREKNPLTLKLIDEAVGFISELFLCHEGKIQRAEISSYRPANINQNNFEETRAN